MKKILHLLLIFTTILVSCKKNEIIFNPKNHLKKFDKSEIQTFDLDTLSSFKIIGKKGTIIHFNRKDFDVEKSEKLNAELTELYDFKEILYKNISTISANPFSFARFTIEWLNGLSNKFGATEIMSIRILQM